VLLLLLLLLPLMQLVLQLVLPPEYELPLLPGPPASCLAKLLHHTLPMLQGQQRSACQWHQIRKQRPSRPAQLHPTSSQGG
jgi:hypothetical protein